MIAGVVLAGGRSSRFGAEKAVALVDGTPMIARVLAVLGEECVVLAVNARVGSGAAAYAEAHRLRLLSDADGLPDGPLTGVLAGLEWARDQGFDRLATAPCDTPHLPPDLVVRLAEAGGAAYAETSEGPHPLCAIWRVADLPFIAAALSDGVHPPVRRLLAELSARPVSFPDPAVFANLNTPDLIAPSRR